MALVGTGTLTAVNTSTPWYTLTGRNDVWRSGAISSALVLERQNVGNVDPTQVRRTGVSLYNEGSVVLDAGTEGTLQYRLTCTVLGDGQTVTWDISK